MMKFFDKLKKEGAKASSFCVSKASPSGLRPQARVGAQPPEAALSAEAEVIAAGN